MRVFKKILYVFTALLILVNLVIVFSGNSYIYKTLVYQNVDIDDYNIFHNRVIKAGNYIPIPESSLYNKATLSSAFRQHLEENQSIAFVVIRNDSVYYEEYWDQYGRESLSNSFSVAKSIVSILTGIAIDEGKIKSIDQKVSDFIPEYNDGLNAQLTVKHLLTMSAAFNWDESYASLFSKTTKAYYGRNMKKMMMRLKVMQEPGIYFNYQSCNQIVLAYILQQATGLTISEYASEKLWKPLGARYDALWCLDHKNGLEKAYCCFNSNALDFSRIGLLFLHGGFYNGRQIVSEEFVKTSVSPAGLINKSGEKADYYGYSWWLSQNNDLDFYYARGILGQYIIVIPQENVVIVRLGKSRPKDGSIYADYLAEEALKILNFEK
jgi:CubicO group peptidase (beta-lactamase class C family)